MPKWLGWEGVLCLRCFVWTQSGGGWSTGAGRAPLSLPAILGPPLVVSLSLSLASFGLPHSMATWHFSLTWRLRAPQVSIARESGRHRMASSDLALEITWHRVFPTGFVRGPPSLKGKRQGSHLLMGNDKICENTGWDSFWKYKRQ